ncbi:MAG: cation:proton antiporter [Muribaculaceae bacterium]
MTLINILCGIMASVGYDGDVGGAAQVAEVVSGVTVESLISDLALILVLGALSTLIFKKLKQPIVLGYIVAGFLASPHMSLLPSVGNEANIEFWAQIGIVVLLFTLGLEFSFKKLMNVGGSAVVTALIIVMGMMSLGFVTGRMLDFGNIDSLFLGGMLSMSSTTIIIKAFNDLQMRERKFTSLVLAVLVCEDLFAVVMMVLLSSVAINNSVEGEQLMMSVLRLALFLVIWFTVGVFLLPSFFKRVARSITDEMLLVISMGLCLLMAVFSVRSGFSLALGAFVMGSILAGTIQAERIEKVMNPVKDLFGAVFFISVGMMVNPSIISEYWGTIAILSIVVIVGMIVFGTAGMLITGQPLKIAMQSGFSLTQIGEFAFIIASMGMSLGVLDNNVYPIVVAVSVITTFFTPYFIKASEPCYDVVARALPDRLKFLLNRYSAKEAESESRALWKAIAVRYSWRSVLYASILSAIIIVSHNYLEPLLIDWLGNKHGLMLSVAVTLGAMAPFLFALAVPCTRRSEYEKLSNITGHRSDVPLVVMSLFRIVFAGMFILVYLHTIFNKATVLWSALGLVLLTIVTFSRRLRKRMHSIEARFLSNLNERELHRSGRGNNLVSDLHLAFMTVGNDCPFVGERLRNSDIRKHYGVNVVSITRGSSYYPVPTGDMRIFPGDNLAVIGTDEQIQHLLPEVEKNSVVTSASYDKSKVEFLHFELGETSPLLGKSVAQARLRDDYASLLVAIQRGQEYVKPTGDDVFELHDVIWIVGNAKVLSQLK